MNSFFSSFLLISLFLIKNFNCFQNEDNVWETFEENNEFKENYPKFDKKSQELYESGKHRYEVMVTKEINYGNCWRNAIQSLESNCRQLNEEVQSRLALSFANCFLQRSGLQTYPCDESQKLEECLKYMTDRAFNSYTEFFTHTQSVCFYLQSELWQQNTDSTIDRLTQTSVKVKNRLEDASKQLDQLNGLQELSIGSQMKLNEELTAARDTITEFKTSSAEQRFIVKEILDRFIRLQDFVLIEISYGYSLLFFFVSMIAIYLITTPVRTNDARLWLFIVLFVNLCVERMIASYSAEDQLIGLKSTSIIINDRIWLSRKIALCLMTAILLWFAVTYRNFGRVNYNILREHTLRLNNIENQLNQLLRRENNSLEKIKPFKCMEELQKEYFSDNDSDFTDDSNYSTDGSDLSNASTDTCSTVALISSSTPKPNGFEDKENKKCLSRVQVVTVNSPSYSLRPRKAITYTKNGIIDESVHDFINQVKASERLSKMHRTEQQSQSFLSSDEN